MMDEGDKFSSAQVEEMMAVLGAAHSDKIDKPAFGRVFQRPANGR
jgi:hypothetical protein